MTAKKSADETTQTTKAPGAQAPATSEATTTASAPGVDATVVPAEASEPDVNRGKGGLYSLVKGQPVLVNRTQHNS